MIHRSIYAASDLAPRSKAARILHVEFPLSRRGVYIGALAVFVLAFRELGATVLVTPPACETLALRTYTLSHYGADDMVMALCLMSVAVLLVGYSSVMLLARGRV